MIKFTAGNILTADVEALVNTVNCVGIMGRGIALQFKNAFPKNFASYKAACNRKEVHPGKMLVFDTGSMTNPRYIINFPTKRHWRGKSRIEDIESGLKDLVHVIESRHIRSIAIPPLGSGLGGLYWPDVRSRIIEALQNESGVEIVVYEPDGAPEADVMAHAIEVPKMTAGRAALVLLVHRYLSGLLDPFVTLLELHKLMYFMQEAGEPLRLHYAKAQYGPYGENLRHVLNAIEGHLVSGYADGGDAPDKHIQLVPGAIKEAQHFFENNKPAAERFERVAKLVEGFESPFGLELLATVHWTMVHDNVRDFEDVVNHVYAWNERKRQFTKRQIRLAYDVINTQAWVNA
jgi:O-acetyl-ADP-ribose deacetylase (regulator of RNase III)